MSTTEKMQMKLSDSKSARSVIVSDCRVCASSRNAYHIQCNYFFDSCRIKIELNTFFIPYIITSKNTVTGCHKDFVRISRIDEYTAAPMYSLAVDPCISVCIDRFLYKVMIICVLTFLLTWRNICPIFAAVS